jgi:hypothetical protein
VESHVLDSCYVPPSRSLRAYQKRCAACGGADRRAARSGRASVAGIEASQIRVAHPQPDREGRRREWQSRTLCPKRNGPGSGTGLVVSGTGASGQPRLSSYPMIAAVRSQLLAKADASEDAGDLAQQQNDEVEARILRSGRTNASRAVSDLVRAGLLHRHYQGYRVDHPNRGAQREAVYTIAPDVRLALASGY